MRAWQGEDYLKSEHLTDSASPTGFRTFTGPIEEVLTGAEMMRKQGGSMKKYAGYALAFKGGTRVLGLVKTNESLIVLATGEQKPENWEGKTVTLEVREIGSADGGTEPAIRIMPPKGVMLRAGLRRTLGKPFPAKATASG